MDRCHCEGSHLNLANFQWGQGRRGSDGKVTTWPKMTQILRVDGASCWSFLFVTTGRNLNFEKISKDFEK
jgi:hypothetical protein